MVLLYYSICINTPPAPLHWNQNCSWRRLLPTHRISIPKCRTHTRKMHATIISTKAVSYTNATCFYQITKFNGAHEAIPSPCLNTCLSSAENSFWILAESPLKSTERHWWSFHWIDHLLWSKEHLQMHWFQVYSRRFRMRQWFPIADSLLHSFQ